MFEPLRRPTILVGALVALLAVPAFGQKSAGERLDDVALLARTKAALVESNRGAAAGINVEIYKGRVQLAGFVASEADKSAALKSARGAGAAEVLDALVVMSGQRTAGETVDDTSLSARLKARLLEMQGLSRAIAINTEVRRGEIILSGFVPADEYRERAGKIAAEVGGSAKVHNRIALKN